MSKMQTTVLSAVLSAALSMALAMPAMAHQGENHQGGAAAKAATAVGTPADAQAAAATDVKAEGTHDARTYFTDTELLDQNGKRVRFYSDVLKDRVVLINVVFTNCKDACPLITRQLVEVRDRMGERFGKDVFFVSLSSDAERDTPAALKAFAAKQQADGPGWIFLTGKKADMDKVLARLGQLGESAEGHSTLLIAGNVPAKRWSKIRPNAPTSAVAERLKMLADGGLATAQPAGR